MQKRFPKLERELNEILAQYVTEIGDQFSPLIGKVPTHRLFEGQTSSIVREDGKQDETEIRSFSASLEIPTETILYGSLTELLEFFAPIGRQIVADKERLLIEAVHKATDATGNVVDGEGQPLNVGKLLQMLEMVQIDFDGTGRAILPSFVAGSNVIDQYQRLEEELALPQNKRAFEDLIGRKKVEWLAREANRTLVG